MALERFRKQVDTYSSVRRPGSAALTLSHVAAGWVDAALGTSVNPWDVAAAILILRQAIADAKAYQQVEEDLRAAYPWLPVPGDAWASVRTVREQLAAHSAHQGLSVADHLIVATALHHGLTILHEDADFETVARLVPHLDQARISDPPGTGAGAG